MIDKVINVKLLHSVHQYVSPAIRKDSCGWRKRKQLCNCTRPTLCKSVTSMRTYVGACRRGQVCMNTGRLGRERELQPFQPFPTTPSPSTLRLHAVLTVRSVFPGC